MRAALIFFGVLLCGHAFSSADEDQVNTECDPNLEQCGDLDICKPPSDQLSVPEDAVFLFGNTGAGKSTLAKLLAHEDEDMRSIVIDNQYLITGNRIGSSIASVTKVPGVITDNATGTHFIDCPGFEDTRGSCTEIDATYYMKDVTQKTRRVKVLLLTPHYAVTKGKDRIDFIKMLLHAAKILRSEAKLEGSIALVITKVEAYMFRRGQAPTIVPDDKVKQSVASFLQDEVLTFLQSKINSVDPDEVEVYRRAIRLAEIFLYQNKELEYIHIGIFRAPDEEGRLNVISIINESRAELVKLVHNWLSYANVTTADFGFSVSERTKLFAFTRSRTLENVVTSKLAALGEEFLDSAVQQSFNPDDVPATRQRFLNYSMKLSDFSGSLKGSDGVMEFCIRLGSSSELKATPAQQLLTESAANECQRLEVLQVVSEKPLLDSETALRLWTTPIDKAAETLKARADWHGFLIAMYNSLVAYDKQAKRSEISFPESSSLQADAARLGLFISEPSALVANRTQLDTLVDRVSRDPERLCLDRNVLVVRGEAVLLSEAVGHQSPCFGTVRAIEVYALRTVFIDVDVRLPGVSLSIVAPRLEVIGHPTINLDGEAGAPWPTLRTRPGFGARGADGQAGKAGAPGGHFLAVFQDVIGHLHVSANGGPGGPGQRGGDGGDGMSGGGNGGNGGDGGVGGLGGHPGTARVLQVGSGSDSSGAATLLTASGARGAVGRGGLGGDHRPHTRRRKRFIIATTLAILGIAAAGGAAYAITKANQPPERSYTPPRYTPPPYIPTYHDGVRGQDGVSGWTPIPEAALPVPWGNVPQRAEVYLQHNLNHPYRKLQLEEFLHEMGKNEEFLSLGRFQR